MIGKVVVKSSGYDPEGPQVDDPTLGPDATIIPDTDSVYTTEAIGKPVVEDES